MSPDWITAVGLVGLGFLKFGYEVWEKHRPKKATQPEPKTNDGEPPAQAA